MLVVNLLMIVIFWGTYLLKQFMKVGDILFSVVDDCMLMWLIII